MLIGKGSSVNFFSHLLLVIKWLKGRHVYKKRHIMTQMFLKKYLSAILVLCEGQLGNYISFLFLSISANELPHVGCSFVRCRFAYSCLSSGIGVTVCHLVMACHLVVVMVCHLVVVTLCHLVVVAVCHLVVVTVCHLAVVTVCHLVVVTVCQLSPSRGYWLRSVTW